MTIDRIRPFGTWTDASTVADSEFEAIDANLVKAIDGVGGGAYAPTEIIDIGGAGLSVDTFFALGVSDIPMRGAFPPIDTGLVASAVTTASVMCWCPFAGYPQWVYLHDDDAIQTLDESQIVTGSLAVSPNTAWSDIAANTLSVVAVNGQSPANYANDASGTLTWAACTGGLATGAWSAITWDGVKWVAGNDAGQFAYSTLGASWSAVVNGNPNWLGGPNVASAMAGGKGPGGVARLIAVAAAGSTQWFARSGDHGVTWAETDTGIVGKAWRGIVYRESDDTWLATASDGTVAASVDGGVTWAVVATLSWALSGKLRLVNNIFTTIGTLYGSRILYSRDGVNWKRGAYASRSGGFTTGSLADGNAGVAWSQTKTSTNIFLRFSQKSSSETDAIA